MRFTPILAACDLDGTLLDPDATLRPSVVQSLHDLRAAGVTVLAATGRRFDSAAPILRAAGLDGWCVVQNGAVVRDLGDGRRGRTAYLDSDLAQQICASLEEAQLDPLLFTDFGPGPSGFWVPETPRDPTGFLARYLAATAGHHSPCARLSARRFEGVTRVVSYAALEDLRRIRAVVEAQSGAGLRCFEGYDHGQGVHRMEFLDPGADKWQGVRWVAAELGIAEADTVAVGDDANDLEMLEGAGRSFAPVRGHPKVHAVVDRILEGDDGPAAVIAALRGAFGLPPVPA